MMVRPSQETAVAAAHNNVAYEVIREENNSGLVYQNSMTNPDIPLNPHQIISGSNGTANQ